MKWLQNNLPGVILASACGLLLVVALILALAGTRPASSVVEPSPDALDEAVASISQMVELGSISEYRVVTDRPVFNETRRPVIEVEETEQPEVEEIQVEVADAPKVNLTGVVITPDLKLVSLTPSEGGEAVVFREGLPMQGDYNGWVVRDISARAAVLESRTGQRLELGLIVHDQAIKEPPKPVRPMTDLEELEGDEDGDPEQLSRAEEIRQRIAERREQLRQEAETKEAKPEGPTMSPYATAIRNMMDKKQPGAKKSDDDEQ